MNHRLGYTCIFRYIQLNGENETSWTTEKIVAIVCAVIVVIAVVAISITCWLRQNEKNKRRKYKEREKVDAGES